MVLAGFGARAQTCNASLTWTQTPGTSSVVFTNTSTVSSPVPPSANPTTGKYISFNGTINTFPFTNTYTAYYGTPGTYQVTVWVNYFDSVNNQVYQCSDTTNYWITVAPTPCYSTISSVTGAGATRTFTASTPAGTPGMTYSWSWGDGTPAGTGATASHTYASSGNYWVMLTATGAGCVDTATMVVAITIPINCASLSNSFASINNGSYMGFVPTATAVPGASVSHSWSWGDGTANTSTSGSFPTAYHSYAAGGTYTVILTTTWVQNGVTCTQTSTQTVTYAPPPCSVNFTSGGTGSTRTYTATNMAGTVGMTYSWFFGDGTSATGSPVTHTFAYGGIYGVLLVGSSTTANCSDSVFLADTVAGPFNCPSVSSSIGGGAGTSMTKTFIGYTYANSIGTYTTTFSWDFGNGATAIGNQVTYTYPLAGTYNVRLITNWFSGGTLVCADTAYTPVVAGVLFNCATASNSFTVTGSAGYKWFIPTVTPSSTLGVTISNTWTWGDGTTTAGTNSSGIGHNYLQPGTFTACLVTRWMQSGTTNVLCADTFCAPVTVTLPNVIYGYVHVDSVVNQPIDSFKVWLISYDAQTSLLAAVDSMTVGSTGPASFQFMNKPAGIYRTKAHKLNQTAGSLGFAPTYRDSSLTWNGAQTFVHNNATTWSGGIFLRAALVTAGPGFVGGSVLQGANKGTADGDPVVNQLVFLRDAATGALVRSAYTNSAGQYSFTNLPLGSYTVYPEEMNYATTPSPTLTLSASASSENNMLFKKDDVDMDIKPVSATGIGTAATASLDFTVIPNPTSGKVSLAIPGAVTRDADVRITSMTGQVVYVNRVSGARAALLDLSHLQGGVYFITVSSNAGAGTAKLVITH